MLEPGTAANFRRTFALDGSVLRRAGADGGTQYSVPDFRGQPVLQIDGAGTATRYAHDVAGRLSTVLVREGAGPAAREWTAERWIYGDTIEADTAAAAAANLNGRLWRVFDESGLPLHHDNQTVVKERIYFDPADPNLLHDEITTFDHALTHPWTITMSYRRAPDKRRPRPVRFRPSRACWPASRRCASAP